MASTSSSQPQMIVCRKVLIIESSPQSDLHWPDVFDPSVWTITFAHDNQAALDTLKSESFDLVLTDLETPCTEDVLVIRQLRMVRPHSRVIILTKERSTGDILKAIQNHAFSYFTIPISEPDLRDLIEQSLQQPVWDDGLELIQGTPEYVVMAVRCDLATLDRLMQFLRESLTLPEVESEEVAFAFREIMINAMEHGGKFDPEKYIQTCYLKSKRMILCRVKDPGRGLPSRGSARSRKR